ncbi:MAG: 6-phosphogluconolactonase [Rhizobiaceae bacterium]|nr:6-phosphogluconolactonase [Rhizobiaceae bacterium]
MTASLARHEFPSPDALAEALAQRVARELATAIAARGRASLAVSGGKTPVRFFKALSKQALDWANVAVTLVDERLVPDTDERSNARLVAQNLLQGAAADARFVPLYSPAQTPELATHNAANALTVSGVPMPLDVAVLGMGGDGHTASFFPDAENLGALFANAAGAKVLPVTAKSAGEPRLTMSAQLLGAARFVALHIEGQEKRAVLEEALSGGTKPIATMIAMASTPVEVFWAP